MRGGAAVALVAALAVPASAAYASEAGTCDDLNSGAGDYTLTTDLTCDVTVTGDMTLDLNGHTLTNASGHTITVNNGAKLTVTGNGTVDNTTNGKAALDIEDGGSATLNGGTFTRSKESGTSTGFTDSGSANGNSYYTVLNHGILVIDGATVENSGTYSSAIDNGWYSGSPTITPKSTLVMKSGTISVGKFLKNDSYGVMDIQGGTVQGGTTSGPILNWNDLTISGGTFKPVPGAKGVVLLPDSTVDPNNAEALTVTGGDFSQTDAPLVNQENAAVGTVKVSGGKYSAANKPANLEVADGYTTWDNGDGTTSVVPSEATVTYVRQSEGQSGAVSGQATVGQPYTIMTAPDGGTWNTKEDGTGTTYKGGETVTMTPDGLTLYYIPGTAATTTPQSNTTTGDKAATDAKTTSDASDASTGALAKTGVNVAAIIAVAVVALAAGIALTVVRKARH